MKILIFVSSQSKYKSPVLFGGLIARATQAKVTILTVVEKDQKIDLAYQVLHKAQSWISDLDAKTSFRVGSEVDCILEEIKAGDYDLLVLKFHHAKRIRYFLGSQTSTKVKKHSLKSVLIVKKRRTDVKNILICTCGKDIANPVIEFGTWLASATKAKVTVLHVMSAIPSMYTGLHRFDEHLSDMLATDTPIAHHLRQAAQLLSKENVDAQLKLRYGMVPDEILLEAQSGEYDLIAIGGSKATSSLTGWLMGNLTQQIITQSLCPVLVVHRGFFTIK